MEIRFANKNDISQILQIEEECFVQPWKENDILYELEGNPVSVILVLENDGLIIGFLDYWITFDSATIAQIAIKKQYQGQHLSYLLMQEMIDDCFAKKVNSITLEVRTSNTKAINLYQKFGFQQIVVKEHYYNNGEDAIYMVRQEGGNI